MQIWQVDWVQGLDPWGWQSQELKKNPYLCKSTSIKWDIRFL